MRAPLRLRQGRARDDHHRAGGGLPVGRPGVDAGVEGADGAHRAGRPRRLHAARGGQLHLLAGDLPPRPGAGRDRRGGGRRGLQPHRPLLARLAGQVDLPRALARDGAPIRPDPEAAHLPPHRRHRGGPDHQPARGHRRPAQLGLPLHLDPRRRLLPLRPAAARLHRGGRGVHGLAVRPLPRERRPRRRAAADHVLRRRPPRPGGAGARPPRGLPRLRPGAGRKRRRHPAAARHLRRADRLRLPLQQVRPAHLLRRLVGAGRDRGMDLRQLGSARRGHLGGARRPPELHLLADDVLGRDRARHPHGPSARPARRPQPLARPARRDHAADHGAGLASAAKRLRPALRHRRARCLGAADAADQVHRAPRSALALDPGRDRRGAGLRQPRLPLQHGGIAGRARGRGGHVLDLHVLVRGGDGPGRAPGRGPPGLREDADLCQPPRPLLRGDRPLRRGARQLPAGVHPPGTDFRRRQPRLPAGVDVVSRCRRSRPVPSTVPSLLLARLGFRRLCVSTLPVAPAGSAWRWCRGRRRSRW